MVVPANGGQLLGTDFGLVAGEIQQDFVSECGHSKVGQQVDVGFFIVVVIEQLKIFKLLKAVIDVVMREVESSLRDLVTAQQLLDFCQRIAPERNSLFFEREGFIHKLTPLSTREFHAKGRAIEEKTKDTVSVAGFRPPNGGEEGCDVSASEQH